MIILIPGSNYFHPLFLSRKNNFLHGTERQNNIIFGLTVTEVNSESPRSKLFAPVLLAFHHESPRPFDELLVCSAPVGKHLFALLGKRCC